MHVISGGIGSSSALAQKMNTVIAAHLQIMIGRLMRQLQEEPFRLGGIAGAFGLFGAIPD